MKVLEAVSEGQHLVYIDDIIGKGWEVHEVWELTKRILFALAKAGFMINMRKSKFLTLVAKIVGVQLSGHLFTVIDKPIIKLFGTKAPKTFKQVQKLVG